MKLINKITLSLLIIFTLTLSAPALTNHNSSIYTNSAVDDQKGKGGGGGDRDRGGRDNGGGRDNSNVNRERPSDRQPSRNDPPRSDDGGKQRFVIKRGEKKGGYE